MSGTLYIVATPIGNLEDITLRALRILKEVDGVLAEDTRRTRPLLSHFGISKPVTSYFEYSSESKTEHLVARLENGENLALVTDAGTPAISDPGARLIAMAWSRGVTVVPVPGPSAVIAALSSCGFPTDPFHFWGFLSPAANKRRRVYEQMKALPGVHGFYESPHKFLKHLQEWTGHFAGYYILVAREVTKLHETLTRGLIEDVAAALKDVEPRGEYTIILSEESF